MTRGACAVQPELELGVVELAGRRQVEPGIFRPRHACCTAPTLTPALGATALWLQLVRPQQSQNLSRLSHGQSLCCQRPSLRGAGFVALQRRCPGGRSLCARSLAGHPDHAAWVFTMPGPGVHDGPIRALMRTDSGVHDWPAHAVMIAVAPYGSRASRPQPAGRLRHLRIGEAVSCLRGTAGGSRRQRSPSPCIR